MKMVGLKQALLIFALLFCGCFSKSPNIVLFVTDDQDAREDNWNAMPFVSNTLMKQGAFFQNFFATSPLCAPSRASIFRSQYVHNHGLLNHTPGYGYPIFEKLHNDTLAVWLEKAGYTNALFGKYFNGYGDLPKSIENDNPENENYSNNNNNDRVGKGSTEIPPGWHTWLATVNTKYSNSLVSDNGKLVETDQYNTDLLTTHSIQFLKNHLNQENPSPFFLYIAPKAPHSPYTYEKIYKKNFLDKDLPIHPSFNESDQTQSTKPYPLNVFPFIDNQRMTKISRIYKARLRTLVSVDNLVKNVVETIKNLGVLHNTYIFFTSDNGYLMGEHRISLEKSSSYEEATRVPMIVVGPGISPQIRQSINLNIDIGPTIAEIANAKTPDFVDGVSFLNQIKKSNFDFENQVVEREVFVTENFEPPWSNVVHLFDKQQGLRILSPDGTYNMMYSLWDDQKVECYDLNLDPYQLHNICNHFISQNLTEIFPDLENIFKCAGETCRNVRTLSSLCPGASTFCE